jgi:hypothetical protein
MLRLHTCREGEHHDPCVALPGWYGSSVCTLTTECHHFAFPGSDS